MGTILHNTNGAHEWKASIWGTAGTDCRCPGHGMFVPRNIYKTIEARIAVPPSTYLSHGQGFTCLNGPIKIVGMEFRAPYTQKNFWGVDRKIPRSVMGNCNSPVSDQLLVQFGQILLVLDQLLVRYGHFYLFQTKFCTKWTKSWSETGKLHFPISDLLFSKWRFLVLGVKFIAQLESKLQNFK